MDPISNADRLATLLRQKLREREKAQASKSSAAGPRQAPEPPQQAAGIKAIMAADNVDERAVRRAVIQNILADQLGPAFINDAQFQQVVTRVAETIEDDA